MSQRNYAAITLERKGLIKRQSSKSNNQSLNVKSKRRLGKGGHKGKAG